MAPSSRPLQRGPFFKPPLTLLITTCFVCIAAAALLAGASSESSYDSSSSSVQHESPTVITAASPPAAVSSPTNTVALENFSYYARGLFVASGTSGGDDSNVGAAVPLKNVEAKVAIVNDIATVSLSQSYYNNLPNAIEAIYKFPLEDSGAIFSFEMQIGDQTISGRIEEKEKAREIYQTSVERGQKAALLEEERPDVFTCSVGNIAAQETVVITLKYVTTLTFDGQFLKFVLPTAIAPQYGTRTGFSNPPYVSQSPYRLSLAVDIVERQSIHEITSPTHVVDIELDYEEKTAHVELSESTSLDRDFVLLLKTENAFSPQAVFEYDQNTDSWAFMISGCPYKNGGMIKESGGENIVFVIDRSGSMRGRKMEQTRAALFEIISSLPPTTNFNIESFGSHHDFLFPILKSAGVKKNIDRALTHVNRMTADYGGTEMLSAIQSLFSKVSADIPLQVLLFTDGEIWNSEELIELVKRERKNRISEVGENLFRLFTVGVGSDVSHHLVNSLASVGGGVPAFVLARCEDRLKEKALLQIYRALSPSLNVEIDWGLENTGLSLVGTAPMNVPPAFLDTKYEIFAVVRGKVSEEFLQKPELEILMKMDGLADLGINVSFANSSLGLSLHRLVTRKLIQEWEEHSDDPSSHSVEIIQLSKEMNVMSKLTSFVLVDSTFPDSAEKVSSTPFKVDVPSQFPQDQVGLNAKYGAGSFGSTNAAKRGTFELAMVDGKPPEVDDAVKKVVPVESEPPTVESTIGVENPDGFIFPLIWKGLNIPAQGKAVFVMFSSHTSFRFYQGESVYPRDNALIGEIEFHKSGSAGFVEVVLEVRMDRDDLLQIKVYQLPNKEGQVAAGESLIDVEFGLPGLGEGKGAFSLKPDVLLRECSFTRTAASYIRLMSSFSETAHANGGAVLDWLRSKRIHHQFCIRKRRQLLQLLPKEDAQRVDVVAGIIMKTSSVGDDRKVEL